MLNKSGDSGQLSFSKNQTSFCKTEALNIVFNKVIFHASSLKQSRQLFKIFHIQYFRLLIFLLAILITACASSSPVFLMMYSACKLNKQGNIQP